MKPILLVALTLFTSPAFADHFICTDGKGRSQIVKPETSLDEMPEGAYSDCQLVMENSLFTAVALKSGRVPKKPRYRELGRQCWSFYCRECPHGSTTGGYPLLFGNCYR